MERTLVRPIRPFFAMHDICTTLIKELLRWEVFLKNIGLPDDMVRRLFNKEAVIGSGELSSKEHSKRFKAENASLKLEQDKARKHSFHHQRNGYIRLV